MPEKSKNNGKGLSPEIAADVEAEPAHVVLLVQPPSPRGPK